MGGVFGGGKKDRSAEIAAQALRLAERQSANKDRKKKAGTAAARAREAGDSRSGQSGTLLTRGEGVPDSALSKKTLLGQT